MASQQQHIVKSFDEEMEALGAALGEMGGLAEMQLQLAVKAVVQRDADLAEQVIAADARVDALEKDVAARVVRLIALRQPMAVDLRLIVSSLKISGHLERIADYAKNIAKRSIVLSQQPRIRSVATIDRLGRLVGTTLTDVLDAWSQSDIEKARAVWLRDEEVDDMYNSLFRELLTYMMEDPRNITACTHLLFIAKNIERIGDHGTNIAEIVQFKVTGNDFNEQRPKGDVSSYTVVEHDEQ